jgi:hypothetical protein
MLPPVDNYDDYVPAFANMSCRLIGALSTLPFMLILCIVTTVVLITWTQTLQSLRENYRPLERGKRLLQLECGKAAQNRGKSLLFPWPVHRYPDSKCVLYVHNQLRMAPYVKTRNFQPQLALHVILLLMLTLSVQFTYLV